jgi:uncharacterized protein
MLEELPKYIDTRRLAELHGTLSGTVAPARFHRIGAPFIATKPVAVEMRIRSEDESDLRLSGRIKTEIKATCQRCLGEVDVAIEKIFDLRLVDTTDPVETAFGTGDDMLTVSQGRIDIEQFVEDEMMLDCPMIPVHDNPECGAAPNVKDIDEGGRRKPFARLAELMASTVKKEGSER